ncbi:MAG TPA: hypothetical protein VGJ05_10250 [Fimbriiglobus sp.]|jgi:hypothetical protein
MSPIRCLPFAVLLALLVPLHAHLRADDKKPGKAPFEGSWTKKDGDLRLEFTGKDGLKIYPHGDKEMIAVVCEYTVGKDGVVKAKVTALEAKEDFKAKLKEVVPVGFKFQFKYVVTKDTAKLEDVTGEKTETIQSFLEGEYEAKK